MSNKPVTPWNELEGRFFKVDVGSTTGDAIASDHQTGDPVVHYTTDGEIVFNGMKFCQQKEDAVSSDRRIVVHKAIPMFPRKGYIYCFQGDYIFFMVNLSKINNAETYNIPQFITSVIVIEDGGTINNAQNIDEITNLRGTSVSGLFLKEAAKKYTSSYAEPLRLLFRVNIEKQNIARTAVFVQIIKECDDGCILNKVNIKAEHINHDTKALQVRDGENIKSLGCEVISPFYRLSNNCKAIYKYGTFEDFKSAAERKRGVWARIYRMKRCQFRYYRKKENGSVFFEAPHKKRYCLKKTKEYQGLVFFKDGTFYLNTSEAQGIKLDLRNYLIQYSREGLESVRLRNIFTKNLIKVYYRSRN